MRRDGSGNKERREEDECIVERREEKEYGWEMREENERR